MPIICIINNNNGVGVGLMSWLGETDLRMACGRVPKGVVQVAVDLVPRILETVLRLVYCKHMKCRFYACCEIVR